MEQKKSSGGSGQGESEAAAAGADPGVEAADGFARAFADAWQEQLAHWMQDAQTLRQMQAWMQQFAPERFPMQEGDSHAAAHHNPGAGADAGLAASLAAMRDALVQCERRLASNEARLAQLEAALYATHEPVAPANPRGKRHRTTADASGGAVRAPATDYAV